MFSILRINQLFFKISYFPIENLNNTCLFFIPETVLTRLYDTAFQNEGQMQLEEITHVLTSFFDLHLTQYMIRKQIYMTD